MTERKVFGLAHAEARRRALAAVAAAPDGYRVVVEPPKKKREQEEKYHAMIGDIAKQATYAGRKWVADDMKRLMVDEFADEMRQQGKALHHDSRLVPSEDGRRVIQLGIQTSQFYVSEASNFIEFLAAWGTDRGVEFQDCVVEELE